MDKARIEIMTSERTVYIDGQRAVDWIRGSNNVGIIVLLNEFIEKRSLEEMSIKDAEALANAILSLCEDARRHSLGDDFPRGKMSTKVLRR